ncbi:MBL fold metallo-hydrolase [Arcanobacterium hippocoleae]|uniref:Glyoxylase-like metal-dependent hydrolase (Beta-lactamase superfamily II) n=1 Tax=Arcanobacterium hippocoleae TaxID=149017 RepID=A0ABU1T035_9ACTO|nr:MBL fold metallo-hydrolase [Arcanobacterium hippocoleae]MDR6938737.1 glyoxylase-like metal-dependent hydrolase (beta-lactamase superfamily II) [Arcanobacterium hippocoleae]
MIILRYSRTFLDANCYLLADTHQRVALVVDPGAGSRFWIQQMLETHGLQLGAVLLTHGHADHVWDVSAFAGDVPVYVPAPDLYRLEDPLASLGMPQFALAFPRMGVDEWCKPANLQEVPKSAYTDSFEFVPGVTVRAVATPGHTEGSSVFLFDGRSDFSADEAILQTDREEHFMLSGDVIFKNGIGRTDLPGGDSQKMAASLRFLINVIRPETYLLPGHGEYTTMFHETRHSPYLHSVMS